MLFLRAKVIPVNPHTLVNKICWYCKCRTDRKYTETNDNV